VQLLHAYSNSLHCPCSKLSINYGRFALLQTKLHEVCSSDFIQQIWIDKVFTQHNQLASSMDDHRIILTFFWQIIGDFCAISNMTWSSIIADFNGSYILSPTVLTEQSVRNQIREFINTEKFLSQSALTRNLYLLQRLISANQFVSGTMMNFELRYPNEISHNSISPKMFAKTYQNCSCLNIDGCRHTATFYDTNGQLVSIPGMIGDCLIIDATLASTLECYYDRTCISLLHPQLATDVYPLSIDENKHFTLNSTIQMLFNEIMLDELIDDIRYDEYYSQCNPSYCSYSYTRRFDVLFVITTIIGLAGTLSMIIHTIASYVASAYLRWKTRRTPSNIISQQIHGSFRDRIQQLFHNIEEAIVNLNLFEGRTVRTPSIIYRERLRTRCFIVLMILSTIAIGFYAFFDKQSQTITINNPSLNRYYQLHSDHSDFLKCPCSKLSIFYGEFMNVSAVLRQVCTSDLISLVWLNYLAALDPNLLPVWTETVFSRDFRLIGSSYFHLLNTFCSLADASIESARKRCMDTEFISNYVLAPSRFLQETQTIIDSFITTANNNFEQDYNWISIAFSTSFFLSGTNVNFVAVINNDTISIDFIIAALQVLVHIQFMNIDLSS